MNPGEVQVKPETFHYPFLETVSKESKGFRVLGKNWSGGEFKGVSKGFSEGIQPLRRNSTAAKGFSEGIQGIQLLRRDSAAVNAD